MFTQRPYWLFIPNLVSKTDCEAIKAKAHETGFAEVRHSNGTPRQNSTGSGISLAGDLEPLQRIIKDAAQSAATVMDIAIDDYLPARAMVMRYRKGEYYEVHTDHEPIQTNVFDKDHKVSLWLSLTDLGSLYIEGAGEMLGNAGDALVFTALARHGAPVQNDTRERYTLIHAFRGPRWT